MAKFYDVDPEAQKEARAALTGNLNIPDTARISPKNPEIASWTDHIEITKIESEAKENENTGDEITTIAMTFDFSPEGTGSNTGTTRTVWHRINNSAYYERRDKEEWQYKFSSRVIGTLESLLIAAGEIEDGDRMTGELMEAHFGGESGSGLIGSRVYAMMTQKPRQVKTDEINPETGKNIWVDDLTKRKNLDINKYLAEEK